MHLSNLAPHSISTFDHTRHLKGDDIIFTKEFVKVVIKWTKIIQSRDRVQVITLPETRPDICPFRAIIV